MATYPPNAPVTTHWTGSPTLAVLGTTCITMEYACIRLSLEYPTLL
jgi:hypothetical protein